MLAAVIWSTIGGDVSHELTGSSAVASSTERLRCCEVRMVA